MNEESEKGQNSKIIRSRDWTPFFPAFYTAGIYEPAPEVTRKSIDPKEDNIISSGTEEQPNTSEIVLIDNIHKTRED